MSVLLTGANGFLGYYLTRLLLDRGYEVIATGKGECRLPFTDHPGFIYVPMDFTDPYAVHDRFHDHQPDVIIHAGAMSKPDECETQQWEAYATNVGGTLTLLANASEQGCFFVFISTDFVFSGEEGMYREDDAADPVNFYGKTKQEAEEAVMEYEAGWAIVRTVLVYGKPLTGKGNLLTVVKEKLERGEGYSVFCDQVRTPTYVEDLASGILAIVEKKAKGIYHLCGNDILTPYDMAVRTAAYLGLDASLLRKVTAVDMQQPAKRPLKTGLHIDKAAQDLGYRPIPFEEGLAKTFS